MKLLVMHLGRSRINPRHEEFGIYDGELRHLGVMLLREEHLPHLGDFVADWVSRFGSTAVPYPNWTAYDNLRR